VVRAGGRFALNLPRSGASPASRLHDIAHQAWYDWRHEVDCSFLATLARQDDRSGWRPAPIYGSRLLPPLFGEAVHALAQTTALVQAKKPGN